MHNYHNMTIAAENVYRRFKNIDTDNEITNNFDGTISAFNKAFRARLISIIQDKAKIRNNINYVTYTDSMEKTFIEGLKDFPLKNGGMSSNEITSIDMGAKALKNVVVENSKLLKRVMLITGLASDEYNKVSSDKHISYYPIPLSDFELNQLEELIDTFKYNQGDKDPHVIIHDRPSVQSHGELNGDTIQNSMSTKAYVIHNNLSLYGDMHNHGASTNPSTKTPIAFIIELYLAYWKFLNATADVVLSDETLNNLKNRMTILTKHVVSFLNTHNRKNDRDLLFYEVGTTGDKYFSITKRGVDAVLNGVLDVDAIRNYVLNNKVTGITISDAIEEHVKALTDYRTSLTLDSIDDAKRRKEAFVSKFIGEFNRTFVTHTKVVRGDFNTMDVSGEHVFKNVLELLSKKVGTSFLTYGDVVYHCFIKSKLSKKDTHLIYMATVLAEIMSKEIVEL